MNQKRSEIERVHQEADSLLAQKAQEIIDMKTSIEKLEEELVRLTSELQAKTENYEEISEEEEEDFSEDNLIKDQEAEVLTLTENHKEKFAAMTENFRKSIVDAQNWARAKVEAAKAEKLEELANFEKKYEEMKKGIADEILEATRQQFKFEQTERQTVSMQSERIKMLQDKIYDVTSLAREEEREIRSKIDECINTIELRQRQHEDSLKKLENDLSKRKEQYEAHLQQLAEQYEKEKIRMTQAISAENQKVTQLLSLTKKIDRVCNDRIQDCTKDIQTMKMTLRKRESMVKEDKDLRATMSHVQDVEAQCKTTQEEIRMVEEELTELGEENTKLKAELAQLDEEVYNTM